VDTSKIYTEFSRQPIVTNITSILLFDVMSFQLGFAAFMNNADDSFTFAVVHAAR
jgi:hypothetical protein